MAKSRFIHLHTHSHYSLLDGLSRIEDIIDKCIDFGMDAVALTDHGNLYGAIEFYKACKEKGIKPIIGCEFYIASGSYTSKVPKVDQKRYHLTVLAKNITGYHNLIQLVSKSWLEGFYYKPRIDLEILTKYSEGLICLSGCLNSQISKTILANKTDEAEKLISRMQDIFGKNNFYLELQPHPNIPEQQIVNKTLVNFSKSLKIPVVLTYDSHYIKPIHKTAQDVLIAIQTNETDPEERLSMKKEDFSFPDEAKMMQYLELLDLPEESLVNTSLIKDLIDIDLTPKRKIMPFFKVPEGETDFSYLKKLAEAGIKKRFNFDLLNETQKKTIKKRLDYELKIIQQTGFSSYLLIVQDFVNHAKRCGIVVGPGRGSAAGSLVSYALNITEIDPIKYGLMFERFLDPERITFPDIDIDFTDRRRDEVIEYARQKYGQDNVAQIITFGKIKSKQAVRDVGRILGLPYSFCDSISKLIPTNFPLKRASLEIPELRKQYTSDPKVRELIDIAIDLEGVARHVSKHACGVVMADKALHNYLPLQYATADSKGENNAIISQYDMKAIEEIGLLKMDFLGLRNLTIIEDTLNLIKKYKNTVLNVESDDYTDKKTFDLLQRGATVGVFQLESDGMRRYLSELKPTELEDIIAMISLYRPGPLDAGQVEHYINRKHQREKIEYLHPSLEPILRKTYGIAVYQEQLIEIARQLAGFSYSQADKLRRAVGKKIKSLLVEEGEKLVTGMIKNNIKEQVAKRIWNWFVPFARYGFNRSHAASYAVIAYRTAYLKANFPLYFICSLLINEGYKIERVAQLLDETKRLGIEILPPDINESDENFTPIEENNRQKVRFGLGVIRNVGENLVKSIIQERNDKGKFKNLADFIQRVKHKDLNKKSLEALIKSGCFDQFGEDRLQLLYNVDYLLKMNREKETSSMQNTLFGEEPFSLKLEKFTNDASSESEKLRWEKEFLGLYISSHPLKAFEHKLSIGYSLEKIRKSNLKTIKTVAIITTLRKVLTRSNKRMAFCRIEDLTGSAECIIFPNLYELKQMYLREENVIVIKGKVEKHEDEIKIIAEDIEELTK